jgi:hypothetical protein
MSTTEPRRGPGLAPSMWRLPNRGKSQRGLLAGRASVHVDFHADRHFNDLRFLPGHVMSPTRLRCERPERLQSYVCRPHSASSRYDTKLYQLWPCTPQLRRCGWAALHRRGLTPALRRQDHTTSPSAPAQEFPPAPGVADRRTASPLAHAPSKPCFAARLNEVDTLRALRRSRVWI